MADAELDLALGLLADGGSELVDQAALDILEQPVPLGFVKRSRALTAYARKCRESIGHEAEAARQKDSRVVLRPSLLGMDSRSCHVAKAELANQLCWPALFEDQSPQARSQCLLARLKWQGSVLGEP